MITRLGFGGLRHGVKAFGLLLLSLVLCSAAQAQWTVVNLHPVGATASFALGASGANQVGYAEVDGVRRAILWSGTAASWVDLHPAGATISIAHGASGANQVGVATVGGVYRASLWSGTAASWVDLTPAGASYSSAHGASGANQVGEATVGSVRRASLWSGTAASWVDLNPAGSTRSHAYSASGTNQVGDAFVGGAWHASLWSGSAASWVDLNPAGATYSIALGASGANQVGFVRVGGVFRASLWSGSAASRVDLHPAGATYSHANSVSGENQVGDARVGGVERASLWSGSAASWVDLHAFLPAGFSSSRALSITTVGVRDYIAGYGFNTATNRNEALLWVGPGSGVDVEISSTPRVFKRNGQFGIGFWTSSNFVEPGELDISITGFNQGITIELNDFPSSGESNQEWFFPFENYGVDRFTDQEDLTVTVTATSGSASDQDQDSLRIPLPVVIVQGILTEITDPIPGDLIALLEANGYETDGPSENDYPTIIVLGDQYEYKPTFDRLSENAGNLQAAIFDYTRSQKNYADKVDIVAHSKGGLVARMYLNLYDITGFTVRRLVMAGTPHTGSPLVTISPFVTRIIKEWAPVDPWYRKYRRSASPPAFIVPGRWHNTTLESLNLWQMPSSIEYYLLYGTGFSTKANLSILTPRAVREWRYTDGDGVVSQFSQRGYQIINNIDGSVSMGLRIQAFDSRTLFEVPIAHGHTGGFLEYAKDVVLWSLTRE